MAYGSGAVLALLIPLLFIVGVAASGTTPASAKLASGGTPIESAIYLAADGVTPTGVSLVANVTSGPCAANSWDFYWSDVSSAGPWTLVSSLPNAAYLDSATFSNLTPGAPGWWYAADSNECTGTAISPTLEIFQPAVATLSSVRISPGAVFLDWDNLAVYGGQIHFGSYSVEQSVNGAPWTALGNLTSPTATAFNVSGLSPTYSYAFQVATTDVISGASSTTLSNVVYVNASTEPASSHEPAGLTGVEWGFLTLIVALVATFIAAAWIIRRRGKTRDATSALPPPEV